MVKDQVTVIKLIMMSRGVRIHSVISKCYYMSPPHIELNNKHKHKSSS